MSRTLISTLCVVSVCASAQPVVVSPAPHRYEISLTLDEFSVLHGAAASGVDRYGSWTEFDVRIEADERGVPLWLVGIDTRRVLERVRVFQLAESLGAVESLVNHPAIMTHASVPPETRAELGISDSLIRLSVGIEAIEDLLADLQQAMA